MITQTMTADDQLHDLGAARIDRGDLCISRLATNGVFIHEAGTAVELQSLIGNTLLQLRGFELGCSRVLGRACLR